MSKDNIDDLKQNLIDNGMKFPIYLDYQATTMVDPRVLEHMLPYFTENFGNPHSRSHLYGWDAEKACDESRNQVANLINAGEKEIIFTSGATESNNIAIKGVARFYGNANQDASKNKKHIITVTTEHKCVINACRALEQEGFRVTYLGVKNDGLINLEELKNAICDDTLLVSVCAVNSEIGVIQPLKEIGAICRENNVFFHSDIAQGFGKIPIDVQECNIDLASISGHKIYGPKGIGALYVRRKPRVRISSIVSGGGQERGIRSGTLATPLIVGLGKAAEIASQEMEKDRQYLQKIFDYFVDKIQSNAEQVSLNGHRTKRYPGNVNLSFNYIEGESMILAVSDLAVSSGSACTSASLEPSYVLRAIGVDEAAAHTSLRFGFGRFTKFEEVEYAVQLLNSKIEKLRELSPLWEMVQSGIDLSKIQWSEH